MKAGKELKTRERVSKRSYSNEQLAEILKDAPTLWNAIKHANLLTAQGVKDRSVPAIQMIYKIALGMNFSDRAPDDAFVAQVRWVAGHVGWFNNQGYKKEQA